MLFPSQCWSSTVSYNEYLHRSAIMRHLIFFFFSLAFSLCAMGQEAATVEASGRTVLRYEVDTLTLARAARGECPDQLIEWLAAQNPDFKGDTEALRNSVEVAARGGSTLGDAVSGVDYRVGYAYQSGMEMGESAWGRYRCGDWDFGPRYKRLPVVWFVNGRYLFITHSKARVKFDYSVTPMQLIIGPTVSRTHMLGELPVSLRHVASVEIVEGDKDFRQYIPHLKSWRGKAPVLIFVTTRILSEE